MKLVRHLLIAVGILLIGVEAIRPTAGQTKQTDCTAISERDAQILVYLTPIAFDVRAKGFDVGIQREPDTEKAFAPNNYVFRLDGAPNSNGSSLVGHFAVDRCTGEITDIDLEHSVTSPTLRGVQKLMVANQSH